MGFFSVCLLNHGDVQFFAMFYHVLLIIRDPWATWREYVSIVRETKGKMILKVFWSCSLLIHRHKLTYNLLSQAKVHKSRLCCMENNSSSLFQCLYLQVGEAEVRRECTQLVFGSSTSRLNDKSSLSTIMVKITQTAKASAQLFSRAKISQEWWAFSYYVSFQMLLRK